MNFISRLNIRARLLLGSLLPILATAAVVAWISVGQLQKQGEAEVERLRDGLIATHKQGLKQIVEAARTAIDPVYSDDSLDPEEAKLQVRNIIRSMGFGDGNYIFAWSYDSYNLAFRPKPSAEGPSTNSTPERRQLLKGLIDAGRNGSGFYEYAWENPTSKEIEPKISYSMALEKWEWVIGTGVYVTDVDQAIAAAREDIDQTIETALQRIVLITILMIVACSVLAIALGRTVTRPLGNVTRMMQEIAEGDGDLTQRLPASGHDELSELGRQFNAFVAKIQRTITQVNETTEQLASAAEELSYVATETQNSVDLQSNETDQIASAIHQMAATVHQISQNANEVESAASQADQRSQSGGQMVLSTQTSVRELSNTLQESARTIEALATKSEEIKSVLDVIHEVTDQTNLLALNAAIEAARAGEHGRGFSVVADEVRQLARRSGESADQIRTMIEGYVTESRAAAERMKSAQSQSDRTVDSINEATSALETIEQSVGVIHDQITQIATAAEEQSQVAEDINRNVTRIVEAAAQSATGVSQTSDASKELARLGENLRQLVNQFRIR